MSAAAASKASVGIRRVYPLLLREKRVRTAPVDLLRWNTLAWHRSADLLHFKRSIEQGTCLSILKESIVRGVMITPVDDQKILIVLNETAIPHDRERDPAYLLPHCWRLQDCYSCLHSQFHCSWCAIVRLPTQSNNVLQ